MYGIVDFMTLGQIPANINLGKKKKVKKTHKQENEIV